MFRRAIFILLLSSLVYATHTIIAEAAVTVSVEPAINSVLPGSLRSVYSNVQGNANIAVTWSASGGTLESFDGFTIWTAPATAGTYTVTATSIADNTQSASATFTVISSATVRVSNIPMQTTIYRKQPLVIQSILWGSTNTAVTWSNSGGTLTGNGREVVFSANVPGTYTVTCASVADNSKKSTTTIVVTNNVWPSAATLSKTQPVDCTAAATGKTYEVVSDSQMDAVPWATLGGGDTVRIHPGTYHRQLLISTSGTTSQPIRICGIRDSDGNLPELNGANATSKAGSDFGRGGGDIQSLGGIIIYNRRAAYYGGASYPKNIIIEGLKIGGYNKNNTFTDLSTGLVTSYSQAAACIRVQHGANITIRGNDISGCGNGIFTMANNGVESRATRNLLMEGNYIHGNGVAGDYREHQSYLQSFGLVVQGNYYDHPLPGMRGGQLKTRSVQQFIRYNYFEPAARILDLVEVEDDGPIVYPWLGLEPKERANTSTSDVVANYEAYQYRFIYGNVFHNVGPITSAYLVHGAGDNTQEGNPGGTLYFYHNSAMFSSIAGQTSNYRSGVFDFGPYYGIVATHNVWPTARVTNNAIYIAQSSPASGIFFWNRWMADRVTLDKNWISAGWGTGNTVGGDGTGIGSYTVRTSDVWQYGQINTHVRGTSNLITGSSIPFANDTYTPNAGSPLINSSTSLPGLAATFPPLMKYDLTTYRMISRTNILDIGAVDYQISRK